MIIESIVKLKDFIDKYYYKLFQFINKNDQNTILDDIQVKNEELFVEIKIIFSVFFKSPNI